MQIKIQNLYKNYGPLNVLNDISLNVSQGDVLGIIGASGVGKSTLLHCINGLTSFDRGSIQIEGQEIKTATPTVLKKIRHKIGMIFQTDSLINQKTVYKNVALPMECLGYPKNKIDKSVIKWLAEVGLGSKANEKPTNLSGGQKQRVAIARALTLNPDILLCDEATSALDPSTTNGILKILSRLNQEYGVTIIIVTHQIEIVKHFCKRVAIIESGELVEYGNTEAVFIENSDHLQLLTGNFNTQIKKLARHEQHVKLTIDLGQQDFFKIIEANNITGFRIIAANTEHFQNHEITIFDLIVSKNALLQLTKLSEKGTIKLLPIRLEGDN